MIQKFFVLIVTACLYFSSFAQSEEKMMKHLTVEITSKIDSKYPIMFDRLNPKKHGWEKNLESFKSAFITSGFNVVDSSDAINASVGYKFVMDYDYGYVISQYRMQYKNLTGHIVDLSNNSSIIGVFNYNGRYELGNVAVAIASRFKAFISQSNNDNQTTEPKKGAEAKTKEEKLKVLKDLFEKQLINKEDYDRQKQKILDE